MPDHGKTGVVLVSALGPGPINAMVRFDDGSEDTIVPRGNLVALPEGSEE